MPWKCPVCGYENSDDALFCIKCGAQKPSEQTVVTPSPQPPAPTAPQPPSPTAPDQSVQPPSPPTPPPAPTAPSPDQSVQPPSPPTPPPPPTTPPVPPAPQPPSPPTSPPAPTTPPAPTLAQQQVVVPPPTPQPTARYYILFINTPYSGLINQKVPLSFDIFPSISIGRSPENVIIVPDPEVSRRHAVISLENGELYIEDLNSTNGTYIYDGKLFQPIKGKQKIEPNSIIKLGNQTIIKIIKE